MHDKSFYELKSWNPWPKRGDYILYFETHVLKVAYFLSKKLQEWKKVDDNE